MLLDFETRSRLDVTEVGAHRYAEDPSTTVLCLAYQGEGMDAPDLWAPGEPFPDVVRNAPWPLHAHNAAFERAIWNGPLRRMVPDLPELPPEAFDCTMARAAAAGWPLSLEKLAEAMGLAAQKDMTGNRAMRECAKAARPIDPGRLALTHSYCLQDVRAEAQALARLPPLPSRERQIYLFDARINQRGVGLDVQSTRAIKAMLAEANAEVHARLPTLTGGAVEKQTQAARIITWAATRGLVLPNLQAATVEETLLRRDLDPKVREVLEIRADAAGAAVKKLEKMLGCVMGDGRVRGLLQYHGANTGRWAGRLVQPQNFPRPTQKVDPTAFRTGNRAFIEAVYGSVFTAASDALRPLLIAAPGRVLRRADLNAIEPRFLFWWAGHDDALDFYRRGECLYCDLATTIYGYRVIKGVHTDERQNGKVALLGCGYQCGPATLAEQARVQYGLRYSPDFAERLVQTYRTRWWRVPRLWWDCDKAATKAVVDGGVHEVRGIRFFTRDGYLVCRLHSGRELLWPAPRFEHDEWSEHPSLTVVHPKKGRVPLYGGLIVERVTQASCRDIMIDGMFRAEEEDMPVVLTVHDEVVTEPLAGRGSPRDLEALLVVPPKWAPDLPLAAEGEEGERYGK
jgi:DNA polymerase